MLNDTKEISTKKKSEWNKHKNKQLCLCTPSGLLSPFKSGKINFRKPIQPDIHFSHNQRNKFPFLIVLKQIE